MEPPRKRQRLMGPADGFSAPPAEKKPRSKPAFHPPIFASGFQSPISTSKAFCPSDLPSRHKPHSSVSTDTDHTRSHKQLPILDPQLAPHPTAVTPKVVKVLAPPPIPQLDVSSPSIDISIPAKSKGKSTPLRPFQIQSNTAPMTPSKPRPPPPPPIFSTPVVSETPKKLRSLAHPKLHQAPNVKPNSGNDSPKLRSISTTPYAFATSLLSTQGPTELPSIMMQDMLHNPHHQRVADALWGDCTLSNKPYDELERGLEVSPEKKGKPIGSFERVNKFISDGSASQAAAFFERQRTSRLLWAKETDMALSLSSGPRRLPPPKPEIRLRILQVIHLPAAHHPEKRINNRGGGESGIKFPSPGIALCRVISSSSSSLDVRVGCELTVFLRFATASRSASQKVCDMSTFAKIHEEMKAETLDQDCGGYRGMVEDSGRKRDREIQVWGPWSAVASGNSGTPNSLFCSRFLII